MVAVGVTAFDAADAGPVPTAFVAVTVTCSDVPFVRPEIVTLVAGGVPVTVVAVCAAAPTYGVTVYFVIALPPVDGAVQLTAAEALTAGARSRSSAPPAALAEPAKTTSTQ